ncbi:MAG TPA: biotin/lipoyl-containing protein, partial [Anaerolineales bacterium]|nr:biotin/lipoyl-containing protein [Anaerolineales bacterium]
VEIIDDKHVSVDGKIYEVDFESVSGQPVYSLIVDGKSHESYVAPGDAGDDNWQVLLRGRLFPVTVEDERERRLRAAAGSGVAETGEFLLKSPMPGLVVAIPIEEGHEVKKGQVLLILESMKMQNELKSPRDGIVHRIKVKTGETVEQRQTLLSVM